MIPTPVKELMNDWFSATCEMMNESPGSEPFSSVTAFLGYRQGIAQLEVFSFPHGQAFHGEAGMKDLKKAFDQVLNADVPQLPQEMRKAGVVKIEGGMIFSEALLWGKSDMKFSRFLVMNFFTVDGEQYKIAVPIKADRTVDCAEIRHSEDASQSPFGTI